MAYFIDETGKRGLKVEGRQLFAWDFDARMFVSPVDDAPPKSRMKRCTEFKRRPSFANALHVILEGQGKAGSCAKSARAVRKRN